MKEIDINFTNFKIGNAENLEKATGVTVVFSEEGMSAGLNIAGGGPASRETALLNELSVADKINAVVLGGGSAFGLGAANGVMAYLAERGYGFDTGICKVPLVVQSDIFDLVIGDKNAYPDSQMAYRACEDGFNNFKERRLPPEGSVGAGTGATVGKLFGPARMMKSGLGIYAAQVGELKMGCIIAVNAFGDINDFPDNNKLIAGLLSENRKQVISTRSVMLGQDKSDKTNLFTGNTTIGCVITNGKFSKSELNKIAQMGQDGYAMAISPIHTTADGDSLYVVSDNSVEADLNLAGTLAAYVTAKAIVRAGTQATSLFDIPAYNDLKN